jgi:hypothetical protein
MTAAVEAVEEKKVAHAEREEVRARARVFSIGFCCDVHALFAHHLNVMLNWLQHISLRVAAEGWFVGLF